MDPSDLMKYLDMALRRKWWIIIPFLLSLLGGLAFALTMPKIYEARTLILVQPQRVPEDFVRPIVTTTVEDRLRTITQQVTSRTNLESIIKQYQLFSSEDDPILLDAKVELLRKNITIDVSHGGRRNETNSFSIAYRGKRPKKVMEVTNALASNFISENLKIRESQAAGTSLFIADELGDLETRLKEKEEELKQYKEKYMGGLPEQLATNLSILERLQEQVDQLHSNLRDAENRKVSLQAQLAEEERAGQGSTVISGSSQEGQTDIAALRNELAVLSSRYTDSHPDVIRLKERIAGLEALRSGTDTALPERTRPLSREAQVLRNQLQEVALEIESYRAEIGETRAQTQWYQGKIEETPKREQELLSLNRDYDNLNELYNSMLNRKLEAGIAVSMERKQKGEQFRIIDPAIVPSRPVGTGMQKVLLMSLVLGLGLGGGLAFLMENLDTSYKTPEEVEKEIGLPVLASMPMRYTNRELKIIKTRKILASASVSIGFLLSVLGILFATKGVDKTMDFFRSLLSLS
ncbi:MAG: XrtA system polysaccharide chain length determinant [Desulfatiglans sp.]|jgi:polysaccharide chain length determinant protein (PEP-CTERM system associated)|nr:XrtA system polysaccharide chain length determinant [Desulfatiglans sp.]